MNKNQQNRYEKVSTESFYLLGLHKNDNGNIVLDVSGSTANIYQTTISRVNRTLFCSCPDSKSWARTHGCACKHVCFILSKVFKIALAELTTDYFNRHLVLSEKLMEVVTKRYEQLEAVSLAHQEFVDPTFLEKFQQMKIQGSSTTSSTSSTPVIDKYAVKKVMDEEEELECMICYDIMEKTNSVECPKCHNLVHKACMEKWLESGKRNCIYCRSDVWKDYNKKPPTSSTSGGQTQYKNLLD